MAGGCIVVVIRISLIWFEVKADTLECDGKQQSCLRYGEWTGHHRGLRPGLRLRFSPRRRIVPLRAGGQPVGLTGRLPARRATARREGRAYASERRAKWFPCKQCGMRMLWHWCRENRHEPIKEQYKDLCTKLRGFYQYYGVRSNYKALEAVFEHAERTWRFWLSRRNHKGGINWGKFEVIRSNFPFPVPRIVHNI